MQSQWNDQEAAAYQGALALRVYTSRLLGRDPSLVLHGGGNTSVKIRETNIFGEPEDLLYVKGSGWDLATIEAPGFAPVRMRHLLRLAQLDTLSDTQMAKELRVATIDPAAPAPSVEAILHAIIPDTFVDHTHADALIAISNTPSGPERLREAYGDSVVIVPYIMPGFELAKVCADLFSRHAGPNTIGMVLLNHGIFSFGATAREAYERMIDLVTRAEEYLARHNAWQLPSQEPRTKLALPLDKLGNREVEGNQEPTNEVLRHDLAALRRDVSAAAGAPMIVASHQDAQCGAFATRDDLATIAQQGPATPDHIIRTKRTPLLGRDVAEYGAAYRQYFADHAAGRSLTMLDPAPRIILDQRLGLCAVGRTAQDAAIARAYLSAVGHETPALSPWSRRQSHRWPTRSADPSVWRPARVVPPR